MTYLAALLTRLGPLINQSTSAAVAIISGSFLLYSLANDIRSRVARAFSALLFFVTITFLGDLGVSYSNTMDTAVLWLRFQWIGIAFAPAAYVHLSDAILTTTGIPSRGRRRWGARLLYVLAFAFLLMVLWTNWIVVNPVAQPAPHFQPGSAFSIFVTYFVSSFALSMWFIMRARNRTLTRISRRRLSYLLLPFAAPAIAVFPFLLVSGQAHISPAVFYAVLILFNGLLAILLTFMAYPIAFFANLQPDRQVKAQMLQFFLRGPVVAIATLAVIIWSPRATVILGLPGAGVMPALAVITILALQWIITLARPHLERILIYVADHAEVRQLQQIEERLLTHADFHQLLDAILAALCDYLQIKAAFVASILPEGPRLEQAIGLRPDIQAWVESTESLTLVAVNGGLPQRAEKIGSDPFFLWQGFWLIPLHTLSTGSPSVLVGLLGIEAPVVPGENLAEEQQGVLLTLAARCAEVLWDQQLQTEAFATLKGIIPEMAALQRLRGAARYGGIDALTSPLDRSIDQESFATRIKEALTHYWGGPNLTDSELMNLEVVRQSLDEHAGNPQRAMRAVLQDAIERLKPEGQRSLTTTEWILYNILEMRFIQGRKVRDVAMRLAMSESDLYRKQRVAIEAVAEIVIEMENSTAPVPSAAAPSRSVLPHN